ncbi:hypothetical protein Tco_1554324 [Tanacetum coccineum]
MNWNSPARPMRAYGRPNVNLQLVVRYQNNTRNIIVAETDPFMQVLDTIEGELQIQRGHYEQRGIGPFHNGPSELIIEQRVKVNQKARILELKRRNHEEHCSDKLYTVSTKEDTEYPCPKLHSASTKERSIRRIQKNVIRRIQDTENPGTTMEEYVQFETKRALRNSQVYNWETAMYGKIRTHPNPVSPHHVEEVDLKIKMPFSESDDEDYTNISIKPLDSMIDAEIDTYSHTFDGSLKTNHDKLNLYVPFGIPFDPKLFYKDGACTSVVEAKDYLDGDIQDFEDRLARIYDRQVHQVQVLNFDVLTEEMDQAMTDRLRMEQTCADGQIVFTSHAWRRVVLGVQTAEDMESDGFRAYWVESLREIAFKADLRDYWTEISSAEVRHLKRHALGRNQGARMSGGYFIACMGVHFGVIMEQRLQILTVEVAMGPERQQIKVAVGATHVDPEVAQEGVQADPTPAEATQMPQAAASAPRRVRDRLQRLEEEVRRLGLMESDIIIEKRVKVNQKAHIFELKRGNHEEHCSANLYAVSIKEDTAYPCPELYSTSTKRRSIRRIQKKPYAVFKYKSWNILEYNNRRAHPKKPQHADTENLGTTMEEYVQFNPTRALWNGQVYNWETATYGKIRYVEDVHDLSFFEIEFLAIVYNDTLTSELEDSSKPTVTPHHVEEVDLNIKMLFSESDEEDYTVIYDNDSFYYKIVSVNDLKSNTDNDDGKINVKSYSENISIKPLDIMIDAEIDTYSHTFDGNLKTNHDKPSKSLLSKILYALPPWAERHLWLRFDAQDYLDDDIQDFEDRLARIYDRQVFSIWKAFGGNTRELGSFREETDETTDLHQHLSRLCSQRLETASQDTRDAVTILFQDGVAKLPIVFIYDCMEPRL